MGMKCLITPIDDDSSQKLGCDGSASNAKREEHFETEDTAKQDQDLNMAVQSSLQVIVKEATIKFSEQKALDDDEWDQVIRTAAGETIQGFEKFNSSKWLDSLSSCSLDSLVQDLSLATSCATKHDDTAMARTRQQQRLASFAYAIERFMELIQPQVKPCISEQLASSHQVWRAKAAQVLFILYHFQKILKFLLDLKFDNKATDSFPCRKVQSISFCNLFGLTRLMLDWMDEDFISREKFSSCEIKLLGAERHRDCVLTQLLVCYELCVEYEKRISRQKSETPEPLALTTTIMESSLNEALALGIILCSTFHHNLDCSPELARAVNSRKKESFGARDLGAGIAEHFTLRSVLDITLSKTHSEKLSTSQQQAVNKALDSHFIDFRPEYNIATPWTGRIAVRQVKRLGNSILSHIRQNVSRSLVEDITLQSTKSTSSLISSLMACLHSERKDLFFLVLHYSRALFFGRSVTAQCEAQANNTSIHSLTTVTRPSSSTLLQKDRGIIETRSDLLTPVSTVSKSVLHPDGKPRKRYPSGIYEPIQKGDDAKSDYTLEKKPDANTPFWHTHPSRAASTFFLLSKINLTLLSEDDKTISQILNEIFPVIYSLLDDFKPKHQILGGCLFIQIFSINKTPNYFLDHALMIQQVLSMSIKICRVPDALGILAMCQSCFLHSLLYANRNASSPNPDMCIKISVACQQLIHKAFTTYTGLNVMDETSDEKKQREQQTSAYNEGRRVTPAILVGGVLPLMTELSDIIETTGEWTNSSPPSNIKILSSGVDMTRTALALLLPILTDYTPNQLFADSRGIEFSRVVTALAGLRLLLKCARPVIPHHGGKIMTAVLTVIGRIVANENANAKSKTPSKTNDGTKDALDQFVLSYATSTAVSVLHTCQDRAEEVLVTGVEKCIEPVANVCHHILQEKLS